MKGRAQEYMLHDVSKKLSFAQMYHKVKDHFDTEINHRTYHYDYCTLTYTSVRQENEGKAAREILEILLDKLWRCHRALGPTESSEGLLVNNIIRACQNIEDFKNVLYHPKLTYDDLAASLFACVNIAKNLRTNSSSLFFAKDSPAAFYTDRRFNRSGN